ncbi:MAG: hypothetical protein K0U78_00375 [Actinomycetia bacterium]|nr:hypothetical protein [Actinomycetes bacterium]
MPLSRISGEPTADWVFARLQLVLGGEGKEFITPLGDRLLINRTLSNHISRPQKGAADIRFRASMLSLLPELIETPQEIWRTEEKRYDGTEVYRMRFIKHVQQARKNRFLLLVVAVKAQEFTVITYFSMEEARDVAGIRKGTLLYLNHYALPVKTGRA